MIELNFLAASDDTPMTKRFTKDKDGNIVKHPYPMVKKFTSYSEEVNTIEEFSDAIKKHAKQGHCLLKGRLDRPIINESRAGHTNSNDPTNWMVLDNDGLDLIPHELMILLGLDDIRYIVQYSASFGIVPGRSSYHIFILLKDAVQPSQLKLQLKYWNLNTPEISTHLSLTASGRALRWPLDVSVCQNDKLIFIAPPICGPGI